LKKRQLQEIYSGHLGAPVFIPKGFKLIAVGERCATPTELTTIRLLTLKGSNRDGECDPFRVRISLSIESVEGRATLAHGYYLKSLRDRFTSI
jgi:hypothetical protein